MDSMLCFYIFLYLKVELNSSLNKMNATNLRIIWGGNLLKPRETEESNKGGKVFNALANFDGTLKKER